jgi:translation initiation factor IF-1
MDNDHDAKRPPRGAMLLARAPRGTAVALAHPDTPDPREKTMTRSAFPGLILLTLALATTGCAGGLDALGDILSAPGGGQGQPAVATVEVQEVREARQEIIVRTQQGEQGPVLYDQNTQVIYQNQQYQVRDLERGDVVDMRIQQIQQGYYTDRIEVRTPVQERTGGTTEAPTSGVYKVEGTLGTIDAANGVFALNMTQGGTIQVTIPAAMTEARARLQQHQQGDYVRVEVRPVAEQRAELVRFGWS